MPFTFDLRGPEGPISETQMQKLMLHGSGSQASFGSPDALLPMPSEHGIDFKGGLCGKNGVTVACAGTHGVNLTAADEEQWHVASLRIDLGSAYTPGSQVAGGTATVLVTTSTEGFRPDDSDQVFHIPLAMRRSAGWRLHEVLDLRTFGGNVVAAPNGAALNNRSLPGSLTLLPTGELWGKTMNADGHPEMRRLTNGASWRSRANVRNQVIGNSDVILAETAKFRPTDKGAIVRVSWSTELEHASNAVIRVKMQQVTDTPTGQRINDMWATEQATSMEGPGARRNYCADIECQVSETHDTHWRLVAMQTSGSGRTVTDWTGAHLTARHIDWS